jgi:pimeloyl-ACP methyl ester carboxylesterase
MVDKYDVEEFLCRALVCGIMPWVILAALIFLSIPASSWFAIMILVFIGYLRERDPHPSPVVAKQRVLISALAVWTVIVLVVLQLIPLKTLTVNRWVDVGGSSLLLYLLNRQLRFAWRYYKRPDKAGAPDSIVDMDDKSKKKEKKKKKKKKEHKEGDDESDMMELAGVEHISSDGPSDGSSEGAAADDLSSSSTAASSTAAAGTQAKRCPPPCCSCSCFLNCFPLFLLGFILVSMLTTAAVKLSVWNYYTALDSDMQWTPDAPSIFYECDNALTDSIMVLEPGFMLAAPAMFHIRKEIAAANPKLRVCTLEVSGNGYSALYDDKKLGTKFDFRADAKNMKAVVDNELKKKDADITVFVGGHSRGHVTGSVFYKEFREEYKRVVLVGIDGTSCGPAGLQEFRSVAKYATPLLGTVKGYLMMIWPLLGVDALTEEEIPEMVGDDPVYRSDLPNEIVWAVGDRMAEEAFLRSSSERAYQWSFAYDGPSYQECSDLGIGEFSQYGKGSSATHIWFGSDEATVVGEGGRVVEATHTTLIVVKAFAKQAAVFIAGEVANIMGH